jgi:hypothetical protein
MPMIEPFSSEEDGLMERCELCRAPIEAGQPFMTNSAGLRLVHLACVADEPTANGPAAESGSRGWRSFLQSLVR